MKHNEHLKSFRIEEVGPHLGYEAPKHIVQACELDAKVYAWRSMMRWTQDPVLGAVLSVRMTHVLRAWRMSLNDL